MSSSSEALAVFEAMRGKMRQLIRQETKSAVRKKKMTISAIDTAAQTVTVYEASDQANTITIPYRAGQGIESLTAGQSVQVEWTYDDLSTAVAATPGQGYGASAGWVPAGNASTSGFTFTLPSAGLYLIVTGGTSALYNTLWIYNTASSASNEMGPTNSYITVSGSGTSVTVTETYNATASVLYQKIL